LRESDVLHPDDPWHARSNFQAFSKTVVTPFNLRQEGPNGHYIRKANNGWRADQRGCASQEIASTDHHGPPSLPFGRIFFSDTTLPRKAGWQELSSVRDAGLISERKALNANALDLQRRKRLWPWN
jgi:hypothetical protein